MATPCRLSATAYSIYSQLPSKTGGRLLHPQPEYAPCLGDRNPLNIVKINYGIIWKILIQRQMISLILFFRIIFIHTILAQQKITKNITAPVFPDQSHSIPKVATRFRWKLKLNTACRTFTKILSIYQAYIFLVWGARGSVVGWGIMLQAGRSRVQVSWRSLDFFRST
jgi:hypothetical protein